MAFIGEAAVSKLLEVLASKLVDSALNFVADHKQVKQQLKQWQSMLSDIQAVLNDAEEKQIKNDGVKKWLDDLQDLAYDVDDILDEFTYEELRLQNQNTRAQASTSRVRKLIPTCCTGSNFTPTSFLFNNSMIPKIKDITARLECLTRRRNGLGLREIMSQAANSKGKNPRPLQPTSLVDEAVEYVGRNNEKREMLDLLQTDNSDGVYVLSIVGMGGLGKTTLAQLVYNDDTITESFDHKAWVCVSDDFDAVNITKTILQSITSEPFPKSDLDSLQVKLKEKLSGKRCLLVLDDIWNDSYHDWDILRKPFRAGTKIIITTRLQTVSSTVDPVKTFHLDKLSHDDCLSIFTQHAFKARNFNHHPQLKEVGEKIVRRCNGLPLAAKAIGSLLRPDNDHVDLDQWERIYMSEIWDLPEDRCGIVPALRLSYHHLPSHLKRCFAYCSILPKDYQFLEEEIILLWRAEGFLQKKDVGKQYFQDLVLRSFFQISNKNKSRFVMHDLINDLAQLVAGGTCSKLEVDKKQKFSNHTRHASYIISAFDTVKKFEAFDQANSLRTFLPLRMQYRGYLTSIVLVDLLPRLGFLRVLSLSGYDITEFPDDVFENLRHLRYLNFSDTKIKWLPDSLCILYNLETLILRKCRGLEKLPSKMEYLVNLHYLDIRDANKLKRMPFGIGKLKNLKRLSDFVIGEGDGHHIGELKHLSNLRGDFCVKGLENVNGQDAGEARLNEKLVDKLVLQWSGDLNEATRKREVEERVLESLRPSKKLEQLVIANYSGAKFSSWIADSLFKNMSSLELRNCKSCKSLPAIGRLSLLKDLSIIGLDEVHKIGVELFGENQLNAFASLETMHFESMRNWEEWDTCEGDEQALKFRSLRELSIQECPKLLGRLPTRVQSLLKLKIEDCRRLVVSISSFPLLRELIIEGCKELEDECSSSSSSSSSPAVAEKVICLQRATLSNISKFSIPAERIMSRFANSEHFTIDGWKELESLSQNGFGLVGHRFIWIQDCPQLVSLETEEERLQLDNILPGVESLEICKCERLNRLPKVLHAFTFLTEMEIVHCPGLVSFAESNIPPGLKNLVIRKCENLQYLVDEKENNNMSMSSNTCLLEHLEIIRCDSLICLSSRADMCNGLLHLEIGYCSKLSSLFLNAKLPIKLKHLEIWRCRMLECIAQDFHETTDIESIHILGSPNIKSLPRGINKLSHLQEIRVMECPNLISFEETELPTTTLRTLSIRGCSNFGALPKCINNFTSLQSLTVGNCSTEICFPEEGFPTNLTFLEISNAPKIYSSLVQWGLNRLTSLQSLFIEGEGCSSVVSFPEQGIGMTLPPSLTHILIGNFKNLKFMCSKGFQHLTSLQKLEIWNCPKLTSLPEKDMLLSLGQLYISHCPLLEEGCRRGKGREWSKIAHIPLVHTHITDIFEPFKII